MIIINSDESRLVFCNLRQRNYVLGIANFNQGIPIIIVKKNNSVLATKILIYFKINWRILPYPLFYDEFYNLNKYFISRIP